MNDNNYSPLVKEIRTKILEKARASTVVDPWFVDEHLSVVEAIANWLCDLYPQANRDVVGLSVWFHDIGRLEGIDDGHDKYGASEAQKHLQNTDFPNDKIDLVVKACASHRAEALKPDFLEAKILATADAMSHFIHSFYLRIIEHYQKTEDLFTTLEIVRNKLNRDFNEKILLPEAKERVKPIYDAWMVILNN